MGNEYISLAYDSERNMVNAEQAVKCNSYFCIECNDSLILKKSDKRLKRPHFAHKALSSSCTNESILHTAFKQILYEKILKHLSNKSPLPIKWACQMCTEIHQGNLLKKATRVEMEFDLRVCKPDIALLDDNQKIVAVIEVVVTHAMEDSTSLYYKDNNIPVITFYLEKYDDLKQLAEDFLYPIELERACLTPKCSRCGERFKIKLYKIINHMCIKCSSPMKSIYATIEQSKFYGPENFTNDEKKIGEMAGVFYGEKYSHFSGEKYLANACTKCNELVGAGTVLDLAYAQAKINPHQIILKEYVCECSKRKNKTGKNINLNSRVC